MGKRGRERVYRRPTWRVVTGLAGLGAGLLLGGGRVANRAPAGLVAWLMGSGAVLLLVGGLIHLFTRERYWLTDAGLVYCHGVDDEQLLPWHQITSVTPLGHAGVRIRAGSDCEDFRAPMVGWHELGERVAAAIGQRSAEAPREGELPREQLEQWLGLPPGGRHQYLIRDTFLVGPLVLGALLCVGGAAVLCLPLPLMTRIVLHAVLRVPLPGGSLPANAPLAPLVVERPVLGVVVLLLVGGAVACLRTACRGDEQEELAGVDADGVRVKAQRGVDACRWGEVCGVALVDGAWLLSTDDRNVRLPSEWDQAALVADVAGKVLDARRRGLRAAGDPSIPTSALSRAGAPADHDSERGLSASRIQ